MGGITSDTPDRLAYGEGAYVEIDGVDIGALGEGEQVTLSWDIEVLRRQPLGAKGPLVAASRIQRAVPSLTFMVEEWTATVIQYAMTGLGSGSDANSEWGGGGAVGVYDTSDYHTVSVMGIARGDDKESMIVLINALNVTPPEVSAGVGSTRFALTFEGHYDASDPDGCPCKWYIEK